MSGQILLCSSALRTCTWKIVFKYENNELNELSECMLLKNVLLFRKTPQNCKTFVYNIFQKLYFALLALKVSKTFLCLLACFCTCLLLKVYKTFTTCLSFVLFFFKSL